MMADWTKEWAIVISAGATFILAIAAFLAIWQNRLLQNRERRERLLNEIIEWAEDIRQSSLESIDPSKMIFGNPLMQIDPQMEFLRLWNKCQGLNKKGAYMEKAIAKVFGGNLLSAVEKIIQKLNETIEILGDCLTRKAKENIEKVEEYKKSLDYCAEVLIEEAVKIKTRDIGKKEENMSKEGEATGSNEPTLKDIEEHLKQQDNEMKKSNWLTFAAFGAAVALVGLSLAIVEDRFYYWVVAIGVVVMVMSYIKAKRIDTKK